MKSPIYMDHHATTPVDADVLRAMLPYFSDIFGNPASRTHAYGWRANEAVEQARQSVADLIGATAREIVFTSGATEANNLAILGVCEAYGQSKPIHIITQATEHKSVLDPCTVAQSRGHRVTVLPVDRMGRVSPDTLADAFCDDTVLVSMMLVNNEVGTMQDIAAIGRLCKTRGVLLHTDATQAVGIMPVHVDTLGIALLSMSAHKIYGPKGIGALYVRRRDPRVTLAPQIHGGGHENGLRSGTLNVPGIVGLGVACILAKQRLHEACEIARLRNLLETRIRAALPGVIRYGDPEQCHPGNLCLGFDGVNGETLVLALQGVALSTGSACTNRDLAPSHVLTAMGVGNRASSGNLRFGLGRGNTEEEVLAVADMVIAQVTSLRRLGGRS